MAKKFEPGSAQRIANGGVGVLARLGLSGRVHLLTTVGRRTGNERTLPVSVTELDGRRYVVSPYGIRPWVLNVRAGGQCWLRKGRRREQVNLTELDAEAAVPILRRYYEENGITRPYFDVTPQSAGPEWVREAPIHPVFLIQ